MDVKKMSDQAKTSHSDAIVTTKLQETPSASTGTTARSYNERAGQAQEISPQTQKEIDEMISEYKKEAEKDKFEIPPPSPRLLGIIKRDPLAVWRAIQIM